MKHIFLLCCCLYVIAAYAQPNDCNTIYQKALAAEKAGNEVAAVKGYIATIICDESRAADIAPKLEAVFTTLAKQKKDAVAAKDAAEKAQQAAEIAKKKAEKALAAVVSRDLAKVEELIIDMEYEAAFKILHDAADLGADLGEKKAATIAGLVEVAYYFTETGELKNAKHLLNAANKLQPQSDATSLLQQIENEKDSLKRQSILRAAIPKTDLETWKKCENRYFPNMIFVEGGTFDMGCEDSTDRNCQTDEILHKVSLSDYKISQTEVTVWQFSLYCTAKGKNLNDFASSWKLQGNNPIINTDWFTAADYCNWLTEKRLEKGMARYRFGSTAGSTDFSPYKNFETIDTLARRHYRLPTEAEWEYAARGGKKQGVHQRYSGGCSNADSSLNQVAWWDENPTMKSKRTQAVATLRANALGLYDMTGNVWEWCEDNYSENFYEKCKEKGMVTNPTVLKSNNTKNGEVVLRSGSWYNLNTYNLRVANRNNYNPDNDNNGIGFRVVVSSGL